MFRSLSVVTLLVAALALFAAPTAMSPSAHAGMMAGWTKYIAKLKTNGSNMKGKASFLERPRAGTIEERFKVEIERAVPGKKYVVRVDGKKVGIVKANLLGRGKLQLRTAQFINSPGDGSPLPANFPQVGNNTVVTVGPLSGPLKKK